MAAVLSLNSLVWLMLLFFGITDKGKPLAASGACVLLALVVATIVAAVLAWREQ